MVKNLINKGSLTNENLVTSTAQLLLWSPVLPPQAARRHQSNQPERVILETTIPPNIYDNMNLRMLRRF